MDKLEKHKLVFVINVDWFFISHRLPLALEGLKRGWIVYVISKNTGCFDQLEKLNIQCISIDFDRSGKNFIKEFLVLRKLNKIYAEIKPDIIHHITMKPSIYGTFALKKLKHPTKSVNAVSGLGYSFTNDRNNLGASIILFLLKKAFGNKKSNFIFQNPDDKNFYASIGLLTNNNFEIIKGSGVNEVEFSYYEPVRKESLTVTLLARMLYDKGVLEFINAANRLREKYKNNVQFLLVGGIDEDNPAHIKKIELENKCDGTYIKWIGHTTNVKDIYKQSDIVCLPSYREGLPKSLIEAMAIGRPIVTTDAPGCRECVIDGVNGFLVPIKNAEVLADKIDILLKDRPLRIRMGEASRKKMEAEMSLKRVVDQTFEFYERIK